MKPVVRINDATLSRIGILMKLFGAKSPSEIIDRVVLEALDRLDIEPYEEFARSERAPGVAPSVSHTKLLRATVNGKQVRKLNWASILLTVIAQLKAKGFEGEKLVQELNVPARTDRYENDGYKFRPELGLSVQGQSAADVWKEVDRLAKKWRIPVEVEFRWKQDPRAQRPGEVEVLRSGRP